MFLGASTVRRAFRECGIQVALLPGHRRIGSNLEGTWEDHKGIGTLLIVLLILILIGALPAWP